MHAEERRQLIADETARKGRVSVSRLADTFAVTAETVRRDLVELERRGALRRVHGGALAPGGVRIEPAITERSSLMVDEKARIARAALAHLPHEGTVILDAGTTTGAVVDAFPSDRELTVVTNALPLALRLASLPRVTVITVGGRLRPRTLAAVDQFAVDMVRSLHVDVALVATNGLDADGCTTPDPAEAATKRAFVGAADRVVVLADHTKLGQRHFVRFADLADLDVVITDTGADEADVLDLRASGVEVETA